ncbi:prolyl oligopeptidase family serine peptidase [Nocardioides sp. 1609]|uniref:S9 family peptidase n=1 Tax=Nocardioides sp. 1609 TaxID=2508327 RepID=UPI00107002DD|nr:prolyl oligopeptidase family serine peptidase [Nocardioides sp. 1609]
MSHALEPETISSIWWPDEPRLSPDGRRVVWTAAPLGREGEHAESSLWVADVGGGEAGRRWTRGSEDSCPQWSPDGTRIAFLSDRAERGTAGLHVLDATGGESRPVAVRKRSIAGFAWSPDGARLAFLAPDEPTPDDERRDEERDDADEHGAGWRHHRLWVVPADGGDPVRSWAPERHLVDLAWSPDGRRIALLVQRSPLTEHRLGTDVWVYVVGAGDGVRLAAAHSGSSIGWSGDDTVVWAGDHEPVPQCSGTAWAAAADGGAPRVVGTEVDEECCTIGVHHAPDGTGTLATIADGLDTRLEWLDPATGVRRVAETVGGEVRGVAVVSTSAGPVVAVAALDGGLAGRVLAGRPGDLRTVSDHHLQDGGDGVVLGVAEALVCTASDGTRLDAVVIRPPGGDSGGGGPWPTAVLVHGGPYGRSGRWAHAHPLDWAQLLATRGYAVVMPNYRGSLGRGNAFATAARGTMGSVEWDDVLTTVDAAVAAGIADPDRLGIGGWSQGGFLTAWAVTATDRFRVGVMGAGVSDWGWMAATSDLPDFEAVLGGSRPWDGPGPHRAALGSPLSYAARRTTPLLILHGKEDLRVPYSQAVALHRALVDQPAPLALVGYPREPHAVQERAHQVDLQRRVVEWFDRHVRGLTS